MCDGRFITNEWWYERAGKVSRQKVKKWLKKIKGSYDLTFFRKSKGPEGPDECSYCPLLFAWIVEGFFSEERKKNVCYFSYVQQAACSRNCLGHFVCTICRFLCTKRCFLITSCLVPIDFLSVSHCYFTRLNKKFQTFRYPCIIDFFFHYAYKLMVQMV